MQCKTENLLRQQSSGPAVIQSTFNVNTSHKSNIPGQPAKSHERQTATNVNNNSDNK
jgi:hypothetical protein